MSTINILNAQIGKSGTANQNFTWYQPTVPDGSVRLGRGNSGATNLDVIKASSTDVELLSPKAVTSPISGDNSKSLATTEFITPLLSNRNYVHNGNAIINQKDPAGITITANGAFNAYPDRWWGVINLGGVGSINATVGSLVYNGVVKKTIKRTIIAPVSTGSNLEMIGILQHLESNNCIGMDNSPLTLSFIFNSNVGGVYSVVFRSGGPTGLWTQTDIKSICKKFTVVANIPTKVVFNIPANTVGSFEKNNNSYGASINISNLGTNVSENTNIEGQWLNLSASSMPGCVNWMNIAGNFIEVTDVQLERGNYATPFEHRPYSYELQLCQRYFEKIIVDGCMGTWSQAGNFFVSQTHNFKVSKRASPTFSNFKQEPNAFWTNWGTVAFSGATPAPGSQGWAATGITKENFLLFQTRIPGNQTPTPGYAYTTEGLITCAASCEL